MATRFRVRAAALLATLALAATACGTGGGDSSEGDKGGTLYILMESDFEHLDPARNYVSDSLAFSRRLLTRSLTQYKAKPGPAGNEIVPDLAVGLGQPNEDKTVWKFKLKKGLKYEDGSPITAQDIKYSVERTFAPELPEGPIWGRQLLVGGDDYAGPYEDGHLDSIEVPNDRTIIFNLNRPTAGFNYATTFPMFGPVPEEKDTGVKYDNRPFSSGPYKIKSYKRDKQLVLVRNKHWDPKTDPVRKARPDKIVVEMGISGSVIDQRLIASQGEDQYAIMMGDITAASVPKVLSDPRVKDRMVQGVSGCTRYIGLNTSNEPLDNVKVRQAINYAISRKAYQTARGGPLIGDLNTTIMPPTMKGHQEYNLYPANSGKGDPQKAKQLLAEAGYPNGIELTLTATSDQGAYGPDPAAAVQQSLARAGIKVNIHAVSGSVYYTEIGTVKRQDDMVFYGWCPDWLSGTTYIPPLLAGWSIVPQGNTNVAQYDNPEIDKRIREIQKMTDEQKANQAWGELDKRIMQDAPIVPLMADNRTGLIGTKVTHAFANQALSSHVDLATVGVEQ